MRQEELFAVECILDWKVLEEPSIGTVLVILGVDQSANMGLLDVELLGLGPLLECLQ